MKVLIVVDMQNDFIDGSLGTLEAQAIVPRVAAKIRQYKQDEEFVVYTLDSHTDDYLDTNEGKHLPIKHCIVGTEGWQLPAEVDYLYTGHIMKPSFGYDKWREFFADKFVEEIELVGLCTDICVVSNALILKAIFPEIKISVDASCCAGTTPENHAAALTVMKSCQIEVTGE